MKKTWDIEDITGTLYVSKETSLGHLKQHLCFADKYLNHEKMPYPVVNVKDLIWDMVKDEKPLTEEREAYGTVITSETDKIYSRWYIIFDHIIDDAAASYTYKAAKEANEEFAAIACDLWAYSRALRLYVNLLEYGIIR